MAVRERPDGDKRTELLPLRPARPVRPLRCVYESASSGGSAWITRAMSCTSMPRAATSVATSTRSLPRLKSASARLRSGCSISPEIELTAKPASRSSLAVRATSARVRANTSVCSSGLASSRLTIASRRWRGIHQVDDVIDVGVGRAERRALDVRRIDLHPVGESAHAARERRRDQVRAVPCGRVLEDRLQVFAEAEIEHAIGLVEHDRSELARVDDPRPR